LDGQVHAVIHGAVAHAGHAVGTGEARHDGALLGDVAHGVAAAFGGATLGLLSVVADMMGALGSGTGILMATTIIYGYFEMAAKEGDLAGMKGMIMG